MSDFNKALARQFIGHAINLQTDENIWLEYAGPDAEPLALACRDIAKSLGGIVHLKPRGSLLLNQLFPHASDEDLHRFSEVDLRDMRAMQAYIRIGDVGDQSRLNVSLADQLRYNRAHSPATNYRVENTRWLVVRAPTLAFAKVCGMDDMASFEQFYGQACLFDHGRMVKPAQILDDILTRGESVRVIGRDTDLAFSIKGIGAKQCIGKRNLPDGEVYTSPVKGSVEGHVRFGPSSYMGKSFSEISLRFHHGKVVSAHGGNDEETKNLNRILDTDEGARYPGEFAIAFHPFIAEPVGEILFDEKIRESWHMACGAAYRGIADNGNMSEIHWDMVQIQRPAHGGGEIWIDGRLIRKDGLFVVPELGGLNPEKLAPTL